MFFDLGKTIGSPKESNHKALLRVTIYQSTENFTEDEIGELLTKTVRENTKNKFKQKNIRSYFKIAYLSQPLLGFEEAYIFPFDLHNTSHYIQPRPLTVSFLFSWLFQLNTPHYLPRI